MAGVAFGSCLDWGLVSAINLIWGLVSAINRRALVFVSWVFALGKNSRNGFRKAWGKQPTGSLARRTAAAKNVAAIRGASLQRCGLAQLARQLSSVLELVGCSKL